MQEVVATNILILHHKKFKSLVWFEHIFFDSSSSPKYFEHIYLTRLRFDFYDSSCYEKQKKISTTLMF